MDLETLILFPDSNRLKEVLKGQKEREIGMKTGQGGLCGDPDLYYYSSSSRVNTLPVRIRNALDAYEKAIREECLDDDDESDSGMGASEAGGCGDLPEVFVTKQRTEDESQGGMVCRNVPDGFSLSRERYLQHKNTQTHWSNTNLLSFAGEQLEQMQERLRDGVIIRDPKLRDDLRVLLLGKRKGDRICFVNDTIVTLRREECWDGDDESSEDEEEKRQFPQQKGWGCGGRGGSVGGAGWELRDGGGKGKGVGMIDSSRMIEKELRALIEQEWTLGFEAGMRAREAGGCGDLPELLVTKQRTEEQSHRRMVCRNVPVGFCFARERILPKGAAGGGRAGEHLEQMQERLRELQREANDLQGQIKLLHAACVQTPSSSGTSGGVATGPNTQRVWMEILGNRKLKPAVCNPINEVRLPLRPWLPGNPQTTQLDDAFYRGVPAPGAPSLNRCWVVHAGAPSLNRCFCGSSRAIFRPFGEDVCLRCFFSGGEEEEERGVPEMNWFIMTALLWARKTEEIRETIVASAFEKNGGKGEDPQEW